MTVGIEGSETMGTAVRVNTKLPVVFVMRTLIVSIILVGLPLYAWFNRPEFVAKRENYQFWLFGSFLMIALTLFDLYVRKSYAVWYDDDSVYWRKVGLSRSPGNLIRMRYSEISDVYCVAGSGPGTEAFGLISTDTDIPDIILSADYIRDYNLVPILEKVKSLSHANFEDGVIQFMKATDTSPGYDFP